MSIGGDYSIPVMVNGFVCRNCSDVAYAKQHIDPAHPKSGPYGIDAKDDPTVKQTPSVTFGGGLSGLNAGQVSNNSSGTVQSSSSVTASNPAPGPSVGAQLDIAA